MPQFPLCSPCNHTWWKSWWWRRWCPKNFISLSSPHQIYELPFPLCLELRSKGNHQQGKELLHDRHHQAQSLIFSPFFIFISLVLCYTVAASSSWVGRIECQYCEEAHPPTNQPGIKVHSLVARVCLTTSGPTTDSLLKLHTRLSLETEVSTQQSMFLKRSCSLVASRKVLPIKGKPQNGKQSIVATTVQRGKPGTHFELMCVY